MGDPEMADGQGKSARGEAIARSWATRKANAALVAAWFQRPVCLCGCGTALPRNTLRFAQGHDAKLKACLRAALDKREHRGNIPPIARAMKDHIKFLRDQPELAKAM